MARSWPPVPAAPYGGEPLLRPPLGSGQCPTDCRLLDTLARLCFPVGGEEPRLLWFQFGCEFLLIYDRLAGYVRLRSRMQSAVQSRGSTLLANGGGQMAGNEGGQRERRYSSFNLRPNGRRIRELRTAANWSQAELAEKAYVSRISIGNYETGKGGISRDTVDRMAEVFGVCFDQLVVGSATGAGSGQLDLLSRPDLVGRDAQLGVLRERLCAQDEQRRFVLHGIPGVGKSALALALAHDGEVRRHFQDGILWGGLGRSGDAFPQLGTWAGNLGMSGEAVRALDTVEKRAREVRNLIGGRRMLLLADDVWSEATAYGLCVGGPYCAHLMTTRSVGLAVQIAGKDGAIRVSELPEDGGLELLRQRAGQTVATEPEAARELVRAVGGLPLALVLLGKHLEVEEQSGQPGRIRRALDRLRSAENRLTFAQPQVPYEQHTSLPAGAYISLSAVIQVSDEALHGGESEALYALSVFPPKPNTFSEEAALAVTGSPAETLDTLVDAGLLEASQQARYLLHQTIADYGAVRGVNEAAYRRMAHFFGDWLRIEQNDYRTIEIEQENVAAAVRWATAVSQTGIATDLAVLFYEFLDDRGLYSQACDMTQSVIDLARRTKVLDGLPLLLRNLGRSERARGNMETAHEAFMKAFELAVSQSDKRVKMLLTMSLATVHYDTGQMDKSEHYNREGLVLARQLSDWPNTCFFKLNLSSIAIVRGQYGQAEEHLEDALAIARERGYHNEIMKILMNLSVVAADRGRMDQAEGYLREGLVLARNRGHRDNISQLLIKLGTVEAWGESYANAEDHLEEGLRVASEIGRSENTSLSLINLGLISVKRKRHDDARARLEKGLGLARTLGNNWIICYALSGLGSLHVEVGDWDSARATFDEGFEIAQRAGIQEFVARCLYGLAQVSLGRGEVQEARRQGQRSLDMFGEIGHTDAAEVREWLAGISDD